MFTMFGRYRASSYYVHDSGRNRGGAVGAVPVMAEMTKVSFISPPPVTV